MKISYAIYVNREGGVSIVPVEAEDDAKDVPTLNDALNQVEKLLTALLDERYGSSA
jgi:hypothetical protein